MAGNEDAWQPFNDETCRRCQSRLDREQRIDAGVPRHVHIALNTFGAQVRGGRFGRGEQQVGPSVDGSAIFLLGPGEARIVCP